MVRTRTPIPPSRQAVTAALPVAGGSLLPPELPIGVIDDPSTYQWVTGYLDNKADPTTYTPTTDDLRRISRMFLPELVISTICTLVRQWGYPQKTRNGVGYEVRLRETERHPTKVEKKLIEDVRSEVYWSGILPDEEARFHRETFSDYLYQAAYDALVLDRDFTEFIPDRKGQPAWFRALDGATARWAVEKKTGIYYPVQVRRIDVSPCAEWLPGEKHRARIGRRHKRPILESNQYGYSEIERAMQALWLIFKAIQHNAAWFDHGLSGGGILQLPEKTPKPQLLALRTFMSQMLMGGQNNRRVALMTAPQNEKISFVPFSQHTMKEMEFAKLLDFLMKVFCGICGIDPILIHFQYGTEGQSSALNSSGGVERYIYGKAKGIDPLVRHLVRGINDFYVQTRYPDLEVVPGGLQDDDADTTLKRDQQSLETFETLNEVRARRDLKPLDLAAEKNPANVPKGYLQTWAQMRGMQGGAEGGDEGNEGGDEGGPPGDEGDGGDGSQQQAPPQNQADDEQDDGSDVGNAISSLFGEKRKKAEAEDALVKSMAGIVRRAVRSGRLVFEE